MPLTDEELEVLKECQFISPTDWNDSRGNLGPAMMLSKFRDKDIDYNFNYLHTAARDIAVELDIAERRDDGYIEQVGVARTFYDWQRGRTVADFTAKVKAEIRKRAKVTTNRNLLTRIVKGQ